MNKRPWNIHHIHMCFLKCRRWSLTCSEQNTNDNLGWEVSIEVKATSQEPPPGMMIPEASAVSSPFFLPPQKNLQNIWFYKKSSLQVLVQSQKNTTIRHVIRKFPEFHAKKRDIGGVPSVYSKSVFWSVFQGSECGESWFGRLPEDCSLEHLEGLESKGWYCWWMEEIRRSLTSWGW